MNSDWRKLERAIVALAKSYGLMVEEIRGDRYITISQEGSSYEICLGDFAKELLEQMK